MPLAFARSILTGGASSSVSVGASSNRISEGESVTFTLTTSGLVGTNIGYTITGITDSDTNSALTGNININDNGIGTLEIFVDSDFDTEDSETLVLTLNEPYNTLAGGNTEVTILDTSTDLTASVSRSNSQINEGQSVTFTITSSNVPKGYRAYWGVSANSGISSSDFSSPTLSNIGGEESYANFGSNNTATVTFTTTEDLTTEGQETLTFNVHRITDSDGSDTKVSFSTKPTAFCYIQDTSIPHPVGDVINTGSSQTTATLRRYGTQEAGNSPISQIGGNLQDYPYYQTGQFQTTSWTVPAGVTDVRVSVISGGGGGGSSSQGENRLRGGGGGGGGGSAAYYLRGITPGDTYYLRAGRGGAAGVFQGGDTLSNGSGGGYGGPSLFHKGSQTYYGHPTNLLFSIPGGVGGSGGAQHVNADSGDSGYETTMGAGHRIDGSYVASGSIPLLHGTGSQQNGGRLEAGVQSSPEYAGAGGSGHNHNLYGTNTPQANYPPGGGGGPGWGDLEQWTSAGRMTHNYAPVYVGVETAAGGSSSNTSPTMGSAPTSNAGGGSAGGVGHYSWMQQAAGGQGGGGALQPKRNIQGQGHTGTAGGYNQYWSIQGQSAPNPQLSPSSGHTAATWYRANGTYGHVRFGGAGGGSAWYQIGSTQYGVQTGSTGGSGGVYVYYHQGAGWEPYVGDETS